MPRRQRIEFDDLSGFERSVAIGVAFELYCHMPIERVEEIFRALARYESLVLRQGGSAQLELGLPTSSLLRNERSHAISTALALSLNLGPESSERVITHLAGAGAVVMAVARRGTQLIHEEEVCCSDEEVVAQQRRSAMHLVN